jgi:hypothetical protein
MSVHKGMARSGIRRVTARVAAPDRFGPLLRVKVGMIESLQTV